MPQPWLTQAHRDCVASTYRRKHPKATPRLSAEDKRILVEDYLAPVVARDTSLIDEPRITEMLLQLNDTQLQELLTSQSRLQHAVQRMWTVLKAEMVGSAPVEPETEPLSVGVEQTLQRAFEKALIGSSPSESGDGNLLLAGKQIGERAGRAVGQALLTFQRTLYVEYPMPLRKIQLSFCTLTPKGIAHLATAIRGGIPSLRELDVSGNPMLGDRGMKLLAWAIDPWCAGSLRKTLSELHFRGTGCGDSGLVAVLKSVAYRQSGIVSMSCGDNPITARGFWALGANLAEMHRLRRLFLSDCKQMDNAGAKALSRGRVQGTAPGLSMCRSLQTLDVRRCNLGDSGALALVHALRSSITNVEDEQPRQLLYEESFGALSGTTWRHLSPPEFDSER